MNIRKTKRFSVLLAIMLILLILPTTVWAAIPSTDYRLPAVGSESPFFGPYGSSSWLNPGNIVNDSGSFAGFYASVGTHSYYLKGSNFGFNESMIPSGSTITGIEVAIRRIASPGSDIRDFEVKLIDAAGVLVQTTNKANTEVSWPTDNDGVLSGGEGITTTYGGSNDLWGTTWTVNDIIDSDFGAALSVVINASDGTHESANVDSMKIKVYFETEPDISAPTVSVTTATLTVGNDVTTAQSSELGSVYLVNTTAEVTDQASLAVLVTSGSAATSPVTAINTDTTIGTTGLSTGTYRVYAVDEAGNVSPPSTSIITLTAPLQFKIVSVSASPAAGGTVDGSGSYEVGHSVTLTAAAAAGYNFVNWTEGSSVVSTNTVYTFTMGTTDRTLVANFTLAPLPERVVTTIVISGKDSITMPFGKKTTVKVDYKVKVFDQFDSAMNGIPIVWSIEGGNPVGVTINPTTGQINVANNASAGRFIIKATASGVDDEHAVMLVTK